MIAKNEKKTKKISVFNVIILSLLILQTVIILIPYIWALLQTFKSKIEYDNNALGIPKKWVFENYVNTFKKLSMKFEKPGVGTVELKLTDFFMNSFMFTLIASFISTASIYMVAYACTMCRFKKFSRLIELFVLISMSLPLYGSLSASIKIHKALNLTDNFFPYVIMTSFGFSTMYFFVVEVCLNSIPASLRESAQIDGASMLQVMFKIMIPLTAGVFGTIFLIKFIENWNNYSVNLVYLPSYPTLSYALWKFNTTTSKETSHAIVKITAALVVAFPIFVLFCVFNKYLMNNISLSGGVKE